MRLTSEHPIWEVRNGLVASYPPLESDLKCDCVIIGGGITGALAGHHLAEAGVDSVILDARDIGTGSTGGSTGLLQYEVDVPLRELILKVGEKSANRSYELCAEAITKLQALTRRHSISCGFRMKPSFQLARYAKEIAELETECALRKKLGFEVSLWDTAMIGKQFPFSRPAALFSELGAEIDPHSFVHGLYRSSTGTGLKVYDRTKVDRVTATKRGVEVMTKTGFRIRARRALVAAGFESKAFLNEPSGSLKSTYALVSEPTEDLAGWYREGLIWETGSPYLYMRTVSDGRIIVGGEDEEFVNPKRRDELIGQKTSILKRKFERLFPDIRLDVAYSWAGTFGETKDGLPYIGAPRTNPHVYFALGYGGNGITYSLIAAEIIRDKFLDRANSDAAIFRFGR